MRARSLIGGVCGVLAAAAANAAALDQLQAFLDGTRSARAGFSQTVVAQSARQAQTASGTMAFSRPGKFRWAYDKPYYQLIVGDGERVWIYDRDLNQVTVRKLGAALGASPAALLAGDNALERDFELRDDGRADGLDWVEATPKAAESGFQRVRIGFAGNLPQVMELRDSFGQTTTLVFSRFERNPALDAGLFRFTPPAGADVIGE